MIPREDVKRILACEVHISPIDALDLIEMLIKSCTIFSDPYVYWAIAPVIAVLFARQQSDPVNRTTLQHGTDIGGIPGYPDIIRLPKIGNDTEKEMVDERDPILP